MVCRYIIVRFLFFTAVIFARKANFFDNEIDCVVSWRLNESCYRSEVSTKGWKYLKHPFTMIIIHPFEEALCFPVCWRSIMFSCMLILYFSEWNTVANKVLQFTLFIRCYLEISHSFKLDVSRIIWLKNLIIICFQRFLLKRKFWFVLKMKCRL